MPPNMERIGKLRIARLYLLEKIDEETVDFDRECLEIALKTIEKEIAIEEYKRYFHERRPET